MKNRSQQLSSNAYHLKTTKTARKSRPWLSLVLGLLALLGWTRPTEAGELIDSPRMEGGVKYYAPDHTYEGMFQFTNTLGTAWWHLWSNTNDFYADPNRHPTFLGDNAIKWTNGLTTLILGPTTASEADVQMGINGSTYTGGAWGWPGYMLSTPQFTEQTAISDLTEVNYNMDVMLVKEIKGTGSGVTHWPEDITVTGANGDHFCITLTIYDDSLSSPNGASVGFDSGTTNMLYKLGMSFFVNTIPQLNQWTYYRGDLLCAIKEAIDYGKANGYLSSGAYSNFHIDHILQNGFESQTTTDVTLRLRQQHIITGVDAGRRLQTEMELGTPRNNYTGSVGQQITVGSTAVYATSLGRWVVAGNTGAHTVKLTTTGGVDVTGGSVSVNAASGAGSFKYVNLAKPIRLAANTTYYLTSSETSGGDNWYDADTTVKPTIVFPTAAFTVPGPAWSNGSSWFTTAAPNTAYGPSTMKYAWTFVQSTTAGTLLNNFTGLKGMRVLTGTHPITVTALGRRWQTGNTHTHTVKLVLASTGADVTGGSVSWNATSYNSNDSFGFVALASPVTLAPGTEYYLVSSETSGQDQFYSGADTTISITGVASVPGSVTHDTTWHLGTAANHCNGTVSFLYTSPQP